jgi:hypothetical protein
MRQHSMRPLRANGFVNRRSRVQSAPPAPEASNDRGNSRRIRALARRVLAGTLTLEQADALLAVRP